MKVILLMAVTLDGKIARDSEHFPDWTGSADKKFFVQKTKETGCIIMGNKTFQTIGKPLPKRKNIIITRVPAKFQPSEYKTSELEYTNRSPQEILNHLKKENFQEVILAGGAQINTLFAKENLIDEVILTISPLVFGKGIDLFTENLDLELNLLSLTTLDKNLICVHYSVLK